MLKIRRSNDRLIFNMGIPYLGKTVFILSRGPGSIARDSFAPMHVDIWDPRSYFVFPHFQGTNQFQHGATASNIISSSLPHTLSCKYTIGYVTLAAITVTTFLVLYPSILWSSHCKSLDNLVHVDEIYGRSFHLNESQWLSARYPMTT